MTQNPNTSLTTEHSKHDYMRKCTVMYTPAKNSRISIRSTEALDLSSNRSITRENRSLNANDSSSVKVTTYIEAEEGGERATEGRAGPWTSGEEPGDKRVLVSW